MSCYYAELGSEALLHIAGPDSLKFLQGQTTCDTRTVGPENATLGAYCTPKGRVVCDFLLCEIAENHFALRLRQEILSASAATFGKYIIFSKAEFDLNNTDWQIYGCWGDNSSATLAAALAVPGWAGEVKQQHHCHRGEGFVIVQSNQAGNHFECYINTRSHPELATQLCSQFSSADENTWRAIQIEQGIARIEGATVEEFIPQMLNYDLTGHVSFDKGCYTGQEIVARMHYRGKPKQRLFQATIMQTEAATPGTTLYSAGSTRSAGTVVNGANGCDGTSTALIVAPVAGVESSSLHLGDSCGPAVNYNLEGNSAG